MLKLKPRQVVNECYILQERLGEDSFFELWRASTIFSATRFLLRFLKEGRGLEGKFEDFRDLAMRCYPLVAPAVMDFVEVERSWERPFISSQYEGQRPLSMILEERHRFPLEHICRFVIELAQGLDAFHKQGITYGCLNAENVLIKMTADRVEELRIQKPGYLPFLPLIRADDTQAIMANYAYMAPEAKAGGDIDERSDIYSLGIHFVGFLFGKSPFGPRSKRVRDGSVSLSHVANGLARRAMPERIIRIALRALRRDPRLRYGSTIELIADLRKVLDEQRYELIKSGLSDPLAELEKLNERGDKIDAALALRRLDTADYFRALSEAQEIPPPSRPSLLMPPEDTEALRKYAEIEENEADAGADDDSSISLDYYIEQALKTAGRDKELAALRRVRVEEANDAATATAAAAAPERAPASPEVLSAAAIAVAPDERQSVREMASDAAPLWRKAKPRSSVPIEAGGIVWRSELAPPDLVVAGMERAFRNAFRGMGAVRFIQEPPPGATASAFAAAFARFKAKGLVVDARALPAKADVTDLLRALRPAVLAALEEEPPSSLRILAKRVARFDEDGAMDAAPLGALLRGFDREEPDPEIVESPAGAARLARALAALGRRKRPLVLTLRGAESMGPTAHAVIIELAKISPALPVCGFIFFKPEKVESWHVLSQLTSPKAEPKVKPRQGRRDKSR